MSENVYFNLDHEANLDVKEREPSPDLLSPREPFGEIMHLCKQCNQDMGNQWILGPVCGSCCRRNHRKVTGR